MTDIRDVTDSTRAAVSGLYAAYASGDLDSVAYQLDTDIDWEIHAPTYLFAFAGPRRGRDSVMTVLCQIRATHEILAYEPQIIAADGQAAFVYSVCRVRDRASARQAAVDICDVMRLEDGRIVWFREFIDSIAAAVTLFGGRIRHGD